MVKHKRSGISANHHLTVTARQRPIRLQQGKQVRASVVHLQAQAERWREQSTEVCILYSEWHTPYRPKAVYICPIRVMPSHSFSDRFMPMLFEDADNGWLFKGSLDGEPIDEDANQ